MFKPDSEFPWLTPPEQVEAIEACLAAGLLKWDNSRKLPLKMGGFTDIYANLRDMRNWPVVIEFLAEMYANALRRLRVDRIIEVPEAVSPLSGVVAVKTGLPIVTVREQAKPGRVVSGTLVGTLRFGDRVVIMDDVATNCESKIAAIRAARAAGANVVAIVVLVDRQQGWKKKLAEVGLNDVPVWPAMTLHDIRKYLIVKGLMQRCDPAVEAKNPIIIALDGMSWEDVLPLIDQFRTRGPTLKVNDMLFARGLDRLLPDLAVYGRVMADIKAFDIPNTVGNIMERTKACPPWAVTVHASGGREMLAKAVSMTRATGTKVLAVTVLTSMKDDCGEVYTRQPFDQVMALAEIAASSEVNVDGFVCSSEEVQALKALYPDKTFVVPGVRSPGKEAGDQKRVGTPEKAIEDGATHLVMGRQILGAADPSAEHDRVLREELKIS